MAGPKDMDDIQEKEYKQQQLVEGIITSLHNHSRDAADYRENFLAIAQVILRRFKKEEGILHQPGTDDLLEFVLGPIETFTQSPAERNYLLYRVFEKLMVPVFSRITSAYQNEEPKAEMKR